MLTNADGGNKRKDILAPLFALTFSSLEELGNLKTALRTTRDKTILHGEADRVLARLLSAGH